MINPDMTIYPATPYKHVVSVSSGAPSALLALKAIETYGAENVACIFADTGIEHPDNYRFLADLKAAGLRIETLSTGKLLMEGCQWQGYLILIRSCLTAKRPLAGQGFLERGQLHIASRVSIEGIPQA